MATDFIYIGELFLIIFVMLHNLGIWRKNVSISFNVNPGTAGGKSVSVSIEDIPCTK